jgi:cathepsin F/cysteine peptidase B
MQKLLVLALAVSAFARLSGDLDSELATFADYKQTYNRQYSPSEEVSRFKCFRQNLQMIDQFNAKGGAQHGLNAFTDLCSEEFKVMHSLVIPANKTRKNMPALFSPAQVKATAGSVDWRQKGAVTHVKNQGMCGSCWSFSSTGNMEGQYFVKKGKLLSFSEEELVQCSTNGNMGCNGGLMDNAFEWVVGNGGIDTEGDYPYTSGGGNTGTCNTAKQTKYAATKPMFSGHQDLPNDEDQMATWLSSNGPIAIAVDASSGWQTYSGGIVTDCDGQQLDHGVLLVGYGTDGSTPYWIVKNSWGTGWGENGYIRLQKGTNQCGLNQMPCSITV